MDTEPFSRKDYRKRFLKNPKRREKALETALDIRKFEIELYWKRATYFWTFIAAVLGAYGAVYASQISNKTDILVVLSCFGLVFSVGWLGVNRGSKFWQENWENHLDMLEDKELGPLYKVILSRPDPQGSMEKFSHLINGPSEISVSKINQIISLYVSIIWVGLLFYSLPEFSSTAPINWNYFFIIALTALTCISFFTSLGATHTDGYTHKASIRKTVIKNEEDTNG